MNPVQSTPMTVESNNPPTLGNRSCCNVWVKVCEYMPIRITTMGCVLNAAGAVAGYFLSNWLVLGAAAANAVKDGLNVYFLKDRLLREDADSAVRSVATESQAVSEIATNIGIKVDKFESTREEEKKLSLEDHEKLAKDKEDFDQTKKQIDDLTARLESVTLENQQMQSAALRLNDLIHKVAVATDGKSTVINMSIKQFPVLMDHFAAEVTRLNEENLKLKQAQIVDKQQIDELIAKLKPLQDFADDISKEETQVKELNESENRTLKILRQIQEERRLLEIDKQAMEKLNLENERQISQLKQLLSGI